MGQAGLWPVAHVWMTVAWEGPRPGGIVAGASPLSLLLSLFPRSLPRS